MIYFLVSVQFTSYPRFFINSRNSSFVFAFRIPASIATIRFIFQLDDLHAIRYSRVPMPVVFFWSLGFTTEKPCFKQITSDASRSFRMLSFDEWYFNPFSKLTLFTTKWEWMWWASTWVAMRTSYPLNCSSANSIAIL